MMRKVAQMQSKIEGTNSKVTMIPKEAEEVKKDR